MEEDAITLIQLRLRPGLGLTRQAFFSLQKEAEDGAEEDTAALLERIRLLEADLESISAAEGDPGGGGG